MIRSLVNDNGYIYVCGNSSGVVDDVGDHLTSLLVKFCDMTREDAINLKVEWKETRRYQVEHFAG